MISAKKNNEGSGPQCCVYACNKSSCIDPNLRMFQFPPADSYLGEIWREKCGLSLEDTKMFFICENHFSSEWLGAKKLKRQAIPTLNLDEHSKEMKLAKLGEPKSRDKDTSSLPMCVNCKQSENFYKKKCNTLLARIRKLKQELKSHRRLIASKSDNATKRIRINSSASTATDVRSETENEDGHVLEKLRMKLEVDELQGENKRLTQETQQIRTMMKSFDKLFTNSQLRQLRTDGKRVCWNPEDIAYAVCLHTVGPRAYRYLCKKGFPLPDEHTLRNCSQTVKIHPGTLDFVLNLLSNSVDIDENDTICVLSFDKMRVASENESKSTEGSVSAPENYVQVAMVQGLKKSWKQPIYFDYNTSMTAEIINELIRRIYIAGYTVVAVVCDVGPMNFKLWSQLKISPEKSWFPHPVQSDMTVFMFADVQHLINDIRYHFLDCGLMWGEKVIGARAIKETLQHFSHSDHSSIWKVTDEHLSVSGPERKKTELASQLLSKTTAVAITRCLDLGLHVSNGVEAAEFVRMVDSWFHLFNSKLPTSSLMLCSVLQQMSAWMATPIKPGTKAKRWPFQEGVLISNSSLEFLRCYVAEKYDMEYVIASRLSQDHLEDFFCTMRSEPNRFPTLLEFESRILRYILDNITDLLSPCLPDLRVLPEHLQNVLPEPMMVKLKTVDSQRMIV